MKAKKIHLVLLFFILLFSAKAFATLTLLPDNVGDDVSWYFLGDHLLMGLGLDDPRSPEMEVFYDTYNHERALEIVAYLPALWVIMAILIKITASDFQAFMALLIFLMNLVDILLAYFLWRILDEQGAGTWTKVLLLAFLVANPINLSNFRYRQLNTFASLFFVMTLYYQKSKPQVSAFLFSLSYTFKLIMLPLLPAVLIKSRERLRTLLIMAALPALGTAFFVLATSYDILRILFYGTGIDLSGSHVSLSIFRMFELLGFSSTYLSMGFFIMMSALMLFSYIYFRRETLVSISFIILSLYFLLANFIGPQHIIILFVAFIANFNRFRLFKLISPLYFAIPMGFLFFFENSSGTALLGIDLPYIAIQVITIFLFKAMILITLYPYFRHVRLSAFTRDLGHQLNRIRRSL